MASLNKMSFSYITATTSKRLQVNMPDGQMTRWPDGQMIWSYLDNCQFSNSAVFENHLYLLRSHILILSRQSETICQTQLCLGSSSDERTGITYVFLFFLPFTITIFPTLYLYILLIRCLSRTDFSSITKTLWSSHTMAWSVFYKSIWT